MIRGLRPFWRYYGGKWRAAARYPAPRHTSIVEPFAGAAGYSLRYPDLDVTLVDVYPVVVEMWRWLIGATADDVLAVPLVECVDDLPDGLPIGARYLVGFSLNAATASPRRVLSAGRKRLAAMGRRREGWNAAQRELVASQVARIKHWRVIEGDYSLSPDVEATWFIDPPYLNAAGRHYVHGPDAIDHPSLARWCRMRRGQTIVCENEGADWLPFRHTRSFDCRERMVYVEYRRMLSATVQETVDYDR